MWRQLFDCNDIWMLEIIPLCGVMDIIHLRLTCKRLFEICSMYLTKHNNIHPDFKNKLILVLKSTHLKRCLECGKKTTREYSPVPCFICQKCKDKPPYELVSKTLAKKKYKLKDFHFDGLRYKEITYHHTLCRYYRKVDVKTVAINIHGGKDALRSIKLKSKERSEKIMHTREKNRENKRLIELGKRKRYLQLGGTDGCCYYKRGICRYGGDCSYSHDSEYGPCQWGQDCHHGHWQEYLDIINDVI